MLARTILTAGFAFLLAAPGRAQSAASSLEGRRVTEIRIVDESGQALNDTLPAIPLAPGKPFDIEDERVSLRALYATGRYADIRAAATPIGEGLQIDFIVQRNLYNNIIRIEGLKEPPSEAAALAALRLPLGEPFHESALDEGLARLSQALHDEGFYNARVEHTLSAHTETQQMDVAIHVTPGRRARIGEIQVHNQTAFPDKKLLGRSKLHSKKDITTGRLARGEDRLRKYLVGEGYLGATVSVHRGDYIAESNRVPLTLDVTAGPRVRVRVEGAHFSAGQLRKLLPMYAEGAVDEDLLQEGRRNIRDSLEREGYFDSQVNYTATVDTSRNEQVITYTVDRGVRHTLIDVVFSGNHYFKSEDLESRLQLQAHAFASRGRFSQRMVRDDGDSIKALYRANGFLTADVKSEVLDNYNGKEGDLLVRYTITEGPQTLVDSLTIEGNRAVGDKRLLAVVGSSKGQPYSEANVTSDRNNILAVYYNEGYPSARMDSEITPAAEANRVNVVYRIIEGQRIDVSRVLLAGYVHTRYGIINREVQIEPSGPLREGDVVETERRLYNLAIFNRVQIAPQNPEGKDTSKAVVVAVDEGKRYTIGYGGGFEVQRLPGSGSNPTGTTLSASPRGIFEISKANLGGRAQTISFKVRASTLQYRAVLTYGAPHFLADPKFNVQLTGYADKTRDVNTFNSQRYEGAVQFVDTLSPSTSLLFRYFYRHVLVDASSLKIAPQQIPLFSQPTRISGFGGSWLRDRRNNATDATRGTYNTIDVSLATKTLGSSASFLRGFLQNSTFHPIKRSFVFARSLRFGVEQTMTGTTAADIPLPERFFAGGGTSIRGFGLNQAGPRDATTGFPIGGLALLALNQELRFPLKLPFAGNRVGGTVFYDGGNVYSDVGRITLRSKPHSLTDLNYFSHTVGGGLRYNTPIGPVRIDFGYQLNPAHFQFVNSSNTLQTQQLPHFQFFFNIGPVF